MGSQVPSIVSRHMPDVMNMQRVRLGMDVGKGSEMHSWRARVGTGHECGQCSAVKFSAQIKGLDV